MNKIISHSETHYATAFRLFWQIINDNIVTRRMFWFKFCLLSLDIFSPVRETGSCEHCRLSVNDQLNVSIIRATKLEVIVNMHRSHVCKQSC